MKLLPLLRMLWHDPVWSKVIAGAILAVVGLAVTWKFASQESGPPTGQSLAASDADLEQRNLTFLAFADCREVPQDVRKRYEIARDIASQSARETTVAVLVADAACLKDDASALEMFAQLTNISEKDWAARAATARHLQAKRLDDAKRWAAKLSEPRDRDWWLMKIMYASAAGG